MMSSVFHLAHQEDIRRAKLINRFRFVSLLISFWFYSWSALTHEQFDELKRIAKSEGHGQQGRSRSLLDNALALRHVASHQILGLSLNQATNIVACADIASPSTIRSAFLHFASPTHFPFIPQRIVAEVIHLILSTLHLNLPSMLSYSFIIVLNL
jgi:hypothetical protein